MKHTLTLTLTALWWLLLPLPAHAQGQALPTVNIVAVYPDVNSVKVDFQPVPGAADYRIYEVANPHDCKYSGIWHLDADTLGQYSGLQFPVDASGNPMYVLTAPWPYLVPQSTGVKDAPNHHIDVPALEIEWNNLVPGKPTKLVVEEVNSLGPEPPANLYDALNNPINPPDPTMSSGADGDMGGMSGMAAILGSNGGATPDGNISTNGQAVLNGGPNPAANPIAIARSAPFTVTANAKPAIPSPGAGSYFMCVFDKPGVFTTPTNVNIIQGSQQQVLTEPTGNFDVFYMNADILHSQAFTMNRHEMDTLFDGETPGSNEPPHVAHGVLALSPQKTANFAGGKILHISMEVDAHSDSRRWPGIDVSPANDPIVNWYPGNGASINKSDQGIFFYILGGVTTLDEDIGFLPNGNINDLAVAGAAGQALHGGYRNLTNYQFGRGLDDRSRFDLFLSTAHVAAFEDGVQLYGYDLPTPLPFSTAKVYYTGYAYHTALELQELAQDAPYETFWRYVFPFSSESHWDNLGFEVLPANTSWSTIGSLIKMPQAVVPAQ